MSDRRDDIQRVWQALLAREEGRARPSESTLDAAEQRRGILIAALLALRSRERIQLPELQGISPELDALLREIRDDDVESQLEAWLSKMDREEESEPIHLEPIPAHLETALQVALLERQANLDGVESLSAAKETDESEETNLVTIRPPRKRGWWISLQTAAATLCFVTLGTLYWNVIHTADHMPSERMEESYRFPELEVLEDEAEALGIRLREQIEAGDQLELQRGRERSAPMAPEPGGEKKGRGFGVEPIRGEAAEGHRTLGESGKPAAEALYFGFDSNTKGSPTTIGDQLGRGTVQETSGGMGGMGGQAGAGLMGGQSLGESVGGTTNLDLNLNDSPLQRRAQPVSERGASAAKRIPAVTEATGVERFRRAGRARVSDVTSTASPTPSPKPTATPLPTRKSGNG